MDLHSRDTGCGRRRRSRSGSRSGSRSSLMERSGECGRRRRRRSVGCETEIEIEIEVNMVDLSPWPAKLDLIADNLLIPTLIVFKAKV